MCMCGDTYCWSCGPAQGNSRCEICGNWSADGGCVNPAECEAKYLELDKFWAKMEAEAEAAEASWKA